jgi:hypothetical protein
MNDATAIISMLPWLAPLFLIELGLMIVALLDVVRRERVRGGNKVVWIIVVVALGVIGPIVYLLFGREEARIDGDQD